MNRELDRLTATSWDLVVIGAGIHGAAIAWDAALRGLRVALVEREDFGSGVSWNSLKTIHGGLRYLQHLDLVRMLESVRERTALLRIAPALVRPLGFVIPTYGHGRKGREALAVGLWLYEHLTRRRNDGVRPSEYIPTCRGLSRREALAMAPFATDGLSGGAFWTDAQVQSSERLVVAMAHAAAEAGACVANHVEAVSAVRDGHRLTGLDLRDRLDGARLRVHARVVVNAAGPGCNELLGALGVPGRPVPLLRAVNVVLDRPPARDFAVGASSGDRFLFVVPWQGRTMIGTDYEPADRPETERFLRGFLDAARQAFPWEEIHESHVALVHRGLVPGIRDARGLWTRTRLIDHERADALPGLISVIGVKYTTGRAVAEGMVDLVGRRLGARLAPCRTAVTPLPRARLLTGPIEDRAREIVRHEMACTLADAMLRRLDLGTAGRPATADREAVLAVMARELSWSATRCEVERQALSESIRSTSWPADGEDA